MLQGLPYKLALAYKLGLHKTNPSVPVYHVPHPSLHPCQGHTSALLGPWWAWGVCTLPLAGSLSALACINWGG